MIRTVRFSYALPMILACVGCYVGRAPRLECVATGQPQGGASSEDQDSFPPSFMLVGVNRWVLVVQTFGGPSVGLHGQSEWVRDDRFTSRKIPGGMILESRTVEMEYLCREAPES